MKLHAFNFCGSRDQALGKLMEKTLRKYCSYLGIFESANMDAKGYGNGAGWEAAMMKLDAMREIANCISDDDWLLSVDSDVVFCNTGIFDYLKVVHLLRYYYSSIVGIQQVTDKAQTAIGELNNMSGCSIYLRGNVAKQICAIQPERLAEIRAVDFKGWVLCENEDIVISYLAQMVGARNMPIPDHYYHGNFEEDLQTGDLKSFYHLNYLPTSFLGEPTTGKWDIPAVLEKKGIVL